VRGKNTGKASERSRFFQFASARRKKGEEWGGKAYLQGFYKELGWPVPIFSGPGRGKRNTTAFMHELRCGRRQLFLRWKEKLGSIVVTFKRRAPDRAEKDQLLVKAQVAKRRSFGTEPEKKDGTEKEMSGRIITRGKSYKVRSLEGKAR